MKTSSLHLFGRGLSLVLLTAITSGCATSALWRSTAPREWTPNSPDQVVLITDTNHQRAVAVFFRQFASVGKTSTFRKVGWRLGQSSEELALTPRAIRQFTNSCDEFRSVPLFLAGSVPSDASSQSPGYAVWSSPDYQLTVYIDGLPPGPYTLPTTAQKGQTATRMIVLPLAVAADAALCAGCIFDFTYNDGMFTRAVANSSH